MKKILNTMMFLSIIVEVLLVAQPVFAQVTVTGINDLGTLGGADSIATGINNAGWVVGESITASGAQHPFLWTAQGGMVDLGTLGGADSAAYGINDLGQVVGTSATASGASHAFLWTAQGGMVDLGTLGGTNSAAFGINDFGNIVGSSKTATDSCYNGHAFLWTSEGGMVDLGILSSSCSSASGINGLGQVAGWSLISSGAENATLWTVSLTPPTPQQQIQQITTDVQDLIISGALNQGQSNALISKLDAATLKLSQGNNVAGSNILQAFINQVQAYINAGILTSAQGQVLIDAANAMISQLSG